MACDRAVARLTSAAETALMAVDDSRPTLTLAGELLLSDTDGDLYAEQLSSEALTGEWNRGGRAGRGRRGRRCRDADHARTERMSAGSPRYPLRAAQALRQSETEQQKHKLEREHAELVRAERELDEAHAALETQRAALQAAEPANAGEAGAASALELQRGAAFAERQRERARALQAAVVLAEGRA